MRGSLAATAGAFGVALALVAGFSKGDAATVGDGFNLVSIGTFPGESPIFVTAPSGDAERVFVVVQEGRIRLVRNGSISPRPFLVVDNVGCCGERGLLSISISSALMGFFVSARTSGRLKASLTRRSSNE